MRDLNAAIPAEIRTHIETRLSQIADEDGVEVLFAIESGSRAWGFASPDSDYDVRFVYRHAHDWYLSLNEARDVIERGIDDREIDLCGWDLRKALRLLLKWNPALHEWLVSPITYCETGGCRQEMLALYEEHADLRAVGHHYFSIARSQWHRMSKSERVPLKKYFYVLRPLMALHWIKARASVPPMNFEALCAANPWPERMNDTVQDLIALKRETPELGTGARVKAIDAWVESSLENADPAKLPGGENKDAAGFAANALFRRIVTEKGSFGGA